MKKFTNVIKLELSYKQNVGPTFCSAGINISLCTSDQYEFQSKAEWPENVNYDQHVEKGIIDGLIQQGIDPKMGIEIHLHDIKYDDIYSSERSFYLVSKQLAMASTLK